VMVRDWTAASCCGAGGAEKIYGYTKEERWAQFA